MDVYNFVHQKRFLFGSSPERESCRTSDAVTKVSKVLARSKTRVFTCALTKRDIPAYALVVAKDGPKFKQATGNEEHPGITRGISSGSLLATRAPISMLVTILSRRLGRPVEDKTNLRATYNFTLQWTPGDNETTKPISHQNSIYLTRAKLPKPASNDSPSIFRALLEQLGLQLESEKIGRDVIIIDHSEKPDAN